MATQVSGSHKSLSANVAANLALRAREAERSKVGGGVVSTDQSSVSSSDAGASAQDCNDGVSECSGNIHGQDLVGDSREGGSNDDGGSEVEVVDGKSEGVGVAAAAPSPARVVGMETGQAGRGTPTSKVKHL